MGTRVAGLAGCASRAWIPAFAGHDTSAGFGAAGPAFAGHDTSAGFGAAGPAFAGHDTSAGFGAARPALAGMTRGKSSLTPPGSSLTPPAGCQPLRLIITVFMKASPMLSDVASPRSATAMCTIRRS